ncbi:hypothetical protein AMTRI_Chr06g191320 [Amborella trichopoda]
MVSMNILSEKIVSLLQRCSNFEEFRRIHAQVTGTGFIQCFTIVAKMMGFCSLMNRMDYALDVFEQVHQPNVFLWNTLIRGYSISNTPQVAITLYKQFLDKGFSPDNYAFPFVLRASRELEFLSMALQTQCQIVKHGFECDVHVQTQLLQVLAACGSLDLAAQCFDEMQERDEVSWIAMICAYCSEKGDIKEAEKLFKEMPMRDNITWNAMIVGFIRWGDLESARKLFNQMCFKDVVSWSALISGYTHKGCYKEALSLFNRMVFSSTKPNHITLVSAISSCAHLGSLQAGMWIHQYIVKNGMCLDVYMGTTLIEMYSNCGEIKNALRVFYLVSERDIYLWNTMIEGLAMHGLGDKVLEVFSKMLKQGIRPNEISFVGIMTACSHMGLVKLGQGYFNCMIYKYRIRPRIEHYGCLVDLLGRAGLLNEAQELVKTMQTKPNAVVWGALLGACKMKGNVELGEKAFKELLELEPENSGNYVLMSNIYAAANRWEDVERVRKLMEDLGIERRHGWSSIEVGGVVHEFVQGGKTWKDVYDMLDELGRQLRSYASVTEEVLCDLMNEERLDQVY